jgi:RNA 2',3'-cyclic 3'-phosphodiesterase
MMTVRKLFFALFPPPVAASRIAELGQQLSRVHRLKGAPTAPDRLHCSLHRIDLETRDEASAVERAREAAARVRALPFDVAFDRTATFGKNQRHFVLFGSTGVEPLRSFRAALGSAMYYAELRDGPVSAFTPHVTMLYGGDHTVEEYPVTPIRWRVDAFALVLSVHGEGHQHLDRWRLGG